MTDQYDPKRKGREHIWPAQELKNMSKEQAFNQWYKGPRTSREAFYAGWEAGQLENFRESKHPPTLVNNVPDERVEAPKMVLLSEGFESPEKLRRQQTVDERDVG